MRFEWDEAKNRINKQKHKLSFELATHIWDDESHLLILDDRVDGEERWLAIGRISAALLVVAVHTYRDEEANERIRIISARKATRYESRQYDEKNAF